MYAGLAADSNAPHRKFNVPGVKLHPQRRYAPEDVHSEVACESDDGESITSEDIESDTEGTEVEVDADPLRSGREIDAIADALGALSLD